MALSAAPTQSPSDFNVWTDRVVERYPLLVKSARPVGGCRGHHSGISRHLQRLTDSRRRPRAAPQCRTRQFRPPLRRPISQRALRTNHVRPFRTSPDRAAQPLGQSVRARSSSAALSTYLHALDPKAAPSSEHGRPQPDAQQFVQPALALPAAHVKFHVAGRRRRTRNDLCGPARRISQPLIALAT